MEHKMIFNPGDYDLHTHTRASDGVNRPAHNVRLAKDKGLTGIAITDHDTVAGIQEAIVTGQELGVTVIPGVEISTRAKGKDIHVLGYFINREDELLLRRLVSLRETRNVRNARMIENLRALGIDITIEHVIGGLGRELRADESLGRPHFADALVRIGAATDFRDAFDRYLAEGKPGHVLIPRITPYDAIEWIREAGGAPVLAHPAIYEDDELVMEIVQNGSLIGIEAYHSDHTPEDEARYVTIAKQHNLIPTAGSDYHGVREGQVFHGDLGNRSVQANTIERLWQAAR